jgi:protein-disulfide isomerase
MKPFYWLLGAVLVGGVAWVWLGSKPAGQDEAWVQETVVPETKADSEFAGYVLGSDAAPVEVVEYADFECPFCASFGAVQFPVIRRALIATGKVRWRFRDYPLPPEVHLWSRLAAHTVACGGEQNKAWEMMDALFTHHSLWSQRRDNPEKLFRGWAQDLVGLDMGKYDACMTSGRYRGRIQHSRNEGAARGVRGTPTFFINGRLWDTRDISSDAFQRAVDSVLTKHK